MTPNPRRPELKISDIVRAKIVAWEPGVTGRDYEFEDGTHDVAPITPDDAAILQLLDERGLVDWGPGARGW